MAFKRIRHDERIEIVVEGVTLIISRITSREREKAETQFNKRGQVHPRAVMDYLMPRHIHGYKPDPGNPDTWIEDDDGEMLAPEDFDPAMCVDWTEDVKSDIYDEMFKNKAGEDTRELARNGRDRAGNSDVGSPVSISLTD